MAKLNTMLNIGKEIEKKLISVGIDSSEELIRTGSKEAFVRLKLRYSKVCLVHLYTLQGAVDNVEYHRLPDEVKRDLKSFSDKLKKSYFCETVPMTFESGCGEKLCLVKPSLDLKEQALEYIREHLQNGEKILHGSALLDSMEYEDWVKNTENNSKAETVRPDWVVANTYFVQRPSDGMLVGMVDIRHNLNEFLSSYGGHIGYGVRPSQRRKGYATAMLKKALKLLKENGTTRVMLTCYKDNVPSGKIIEKCGGRIEREYLHTDGRVVQIFWIES